MNEEKNEVVYLYLDDIIPNRFQPREVFDEKALKELAISIKEHGVIQPIIVRKVNDKYEIIAGERRYKASALAGLTKIPAIIRNLDDKESSKVALLENLQRKNLNAIEEARTYQKILEIDQMTQEELAKTMGKSQSSIANKLRLLSLSDEVQNALLKDQISERHARALLNIEDVNKQKEMLKKVIDNKMTVRLLEEEIEKMNNNGKPGSEISNANRDIAPIINKINNEAPISPDTTIHVDQEEEYGKVTIAPPQENNLSEYTNYGEIKKGPTEEPKNSYFTTNVQPEKSVADIKANAENINSPQDNNQSALDNLLNIKSNPISSVSPLKELEEKKYITPAEAIVKAEPPANTNTSQDYFKMTNPSDMGTPVVANNIDNSPLKGLFNVSPSNIEKDAEQSKLDDSKKEIKDLVEKLKAQGMNITLDEMDFDKTYQVIIKIEK